VGYVKRKKRDIFWVLVVFCSFGEFGSGVCVGYVVLGSEVRVVAGVVIFGEKCREVVGGGCVVGGGGR
jgi:hypothetical protein